MKNLLKWLPAIVIMCAIFIVSSTQGAVIQRVGLGRESYHISGHFILFFLLCLTYFRATKSYSMALLLTILYAITDELHQVFVPGRSVSMFDLAIDALGGITCLLILWKLPVNLLNKLKS